MVKISENRLTEYQLAILTIDIFQTDNADSKACGKVVQAMKEP